MGQQNDFPGGLTEIYSGWSGAELDLVPGEGFWARIEQIAVKGEMTRGLDAAMHGQPSPRIWLFLHEPGRGDLSAAVAMSFARELAFRDQAALLLDCDDRDQALTRWADRVQAEGWIDLARYGTSVLTSGVPLPFVGRRGYLLGVGSFAPTEVTREEVDTLLTRLRRQGDDLLLVAPANDLGLLWAPAAGIRILCWDQQTMTDQAAGAISNLFSDAGCPLTAVTTFQDSGAEEILVEEVLAESESAALEADPVLPPEPKAEKPTAKVVDKVEEEPEVEPDTEPDTGSDSTEDSGWRGLPLEEEASLAEMDVYIVDELDPEQAPEPEVARSTSRVFWYGALAAVILIAAIGIYYMKYVRVPSDGQFDQVDIAIPSESSTVRDEQASAGNDQAMETAALVIGADSLANALAGEEGLEGEAVGEGEVTLPPTTPVAEADADPAPAGENVIAETGQDDETPAENPVTTPQGFDMSPYREPVGAKGWALHVYSLPDSAGTVKQVRELDRRGFRSEVRIVDLGKKGRWRRIYLGSFVSRSGASKAMPLLLKELREKWAKPERF